MIQIKINRPIVFLVLAAFLVVLMSCKKKNDNDAAKKGPTAIGVNVIVVQPRTIEDVIYSTGTLLANEEVEIRSEVSGRIREINFAEGNHVKKGDLLVKVVDDDLQAQLKKLTLQEKLAKDDLDRKTKLRQLDAISQEEFDLVQNQLMVTQAEILLVKAQIDKTEIRAPFSGKIGLRYISPGGYLSPSTLIARLLETNPIKIEFTVPEKYIQNIGMNTQVSFRLDGIDSLFSGSVYAVEPKINPETRSLVVRATSPNTDGRLYPGSFAKVSILLQRVENTVVVPSETLIPDINGEKVFVMKNGLASSLYVEIGIRTEREVQIKAGLNPNDSLITTGLLQLRDGMKVTARKTKL